MTTWPDLDVARPTDLCRWVAHDLRQPVATILTLTSASAAEPQLPEPVRQRLAQIASEAQWMSTVIAELLAAGGIGAGPAAEPVEVGALVRAVVQAELLTYQGQIVVRQPDGVPRYVMATGTRLRRAVANVLSNATRAAGCHGQVELTEQPDGDAELIEITDDGPGFGKLPHGHGLGLQIARQMLAECGGRMQIERLAAGRTRVRMLVPIMPGSRWAGGR
jgi:signal transduction histidine kinase